MAFADPSLYEKMVKHRRHLHANPEVGIALPSTHSYLALALQDLGLETELHRAAGISATIPGRQADLRPIVFRADMDALPVQEESHQSYRSQLDGAMHACGHDLHMATLLGVAEDLVANPPSRDVVVVFQPGEESDRGALETLKHASLQIDEAYVFAVHMHATLPTGTIAYSRDVFMAYGDWFRLDIDGPGGHASAPERSGNPIQFGSRFEQGINTLAENLSTNSERVVATVTEFLSGNTVNVIPTHGSLRGTIRSVSSEQRGELHRAMHDLAMNLELELNLQCQLEIIEGYPAVVSDSKFVDNLIEEASIRDCRMAFEEMARPSMVIEDFSYFLQKWTGAMVYVGAAVGENPAFNHSSSAKFDETAMDTAFGLFRILADSTNLGD